MGCWNTVERYINWTLDYINAKTKTVKYVGRKPSASTATGYLKKTCCSTTRNCYKSFNYINADKLLFQH